MAGISANTFNVESITAAGQIIQSVAFQGTELWAALKGDRLFVANGIYLAEINKDTFAVIKQVEYAGVSFRSVGGIKKRLFVVYTRGGTTWLGEFNPNTLTIINEKQVWQYTNIYSSVDGAVNRLWRGRFGESGNASLNLYEINPNTFENTGVTCRPSSPGGDITSFGICGDGRYFIHWNDTDYGELFTTCSHMDNPPPALVVGGAQNTNWNYSSRLIGTLNRLFISKGVSYDANNVYEVTSNSAGKITIIKQGLVGLGNGTKQTLSIGGTK